MSRGTSEIFPCSHAQYLLEKSECLQQVFTISSPTAWGNRSLCRVDSTCAHSCSSCHHLSAVLEKWKQRSLWSHFNGWWVMDTFIWPSAEKTECWLAFPKRKKIAQRSQDALKVMHVMFFSCSIGQYYCALLQDEVRQALHCKQPEPLEHGVILLQNNATPLHNCDVQNLLPLWGWEVLEHPPYAPDLASCLWVNSLNQKTISTLLSLPLYIVWARINTKLQLQMGKVCGECWWLHWIEYICVNIQEY